MNGENAEVRVGNALPMKNIPVGSSIHNIEMMPGKGGQLVRSAGNVAQLMAKEGKYATVKLPSGEMRLLPIDCRATVGQVGNSGYSIHDIITIASMIEKETDGEDQATISSVIYNRLKNTSGGTNGYLQIDATLVYINGGKVPTEADREIDSPYNTYLYQGLPAGPISNPGMVSIYAAIHPESTSYYYYVLNPETNRHDFSRTYSEHQAKVNRYSQS